MPTLTFNERETFAMAVVAWVAAAIYGAVTGLTDGLARLASTLRPSADRDGRGQVSQYIFVAIGVVLIALVLFLAFGGFILDGGDETAPDGETNDTEQADDPDPSPVDDNSTESDGNDSDNTDDEVTPPDDPGDSNESENSTENGDGDEGTSPGDDEPADPGESDDNSTDNDNSTEQDDNDGTDTNETEQEYDEEEYASLVGSVEIQDLGTADDGVVGVYNQSTNELVTLHNLSKASHFEVDGLVPNTNYTVEITAQQAPPREVTVNPEVGETLTRQFEVGHEFSSTDVFVNEWYLNLRDGPEYTNGVTIYDSDGNVYSKWDDPASPEPYKNLYIAETNESYTTFGKGEWKSSRQHFGDGPGVTETLVIRGLEGIEERRFQKEVEDHDGNRTLYQYYLPADLEEFDNPVGVTVNVEPETGYVTGYDYDESEGVIRSSGTFHRHGDETIDAVPEDFQR